MKTKKIEIYQRLLSHPDSESYVLYLKLYGSRAEMEKVREAIFNLEKEES